MSEYNIVEDWLGRKSINEEHIEQILEVKEKEPNVNETWKQIDIFGED